MPHFITLHTHIIRTTELAILIDDGDGETWIPRSCLANDDELEPNGTVQEVEVAEWFAEKEHLV